MGLKAGVLIACLAVNLGGCDDNPFAKIQSLEREMSNQRGLVTALEEKVKSIVDQSARLADLENRLEGAETEISMLKMNNNRYKSAVMDPTSEGFGRIETSIGIFTISMREVSSYADGVKIRLDVGNLTSAYISGGSFKVKWGPKGPPYDINWSARYAEWQANLYEKESAITQDLRPGFWNNISITLPHTPPNQFGYLEVSLNVDQIRLSSGKQ